MNDNQQVYQKLLDKATAIEDRQNLCIHEFKPYQSHILERDGSGNVVEGGRIYMAPNDHSRPVAGLLCSKCGKRVPAGHDETEEIKESIKKLHRGYW